MPTTKHTYQCISRFDPALAVSNFDKHDAKFPEPPPAKAKASAWRRYVETVDAGKHDPTILVTTDGASPIVYTLRPLTRPEMDDARQILHLHGPNQYYLATAATALVAAAGPKPVDAEDVARLRKSGFGMIARVEPDAWIWSDDDVMPDAATTGIMEHAARRWNLSRKQKTFRAPAGE